MYLETQPQGQPVKEKKPSALLREGMKEVTESRACYLEGSGDSWRGCANGTIAYAAGVRGNSQDAAEWCWSNLGADLMAYINLRHSYIGYGESREEIAAWLEAQGK